MLPDPLHPAVVHLPIALALLVPLFAALLGLAIRAGRSRLRGWSLVVLMQALLVGSAWLAEETGHDQEERVEKVVDERYIEEHEESAERVVWLSAAGLVVAAAGLAGGSPGGWARLAAFVVSLATLAGVTVTGHSGGELVYRHGAASAYVGKAAAAAPADGSHEH
jgi:uncharacterized membrane protein